MTSWRKRNGSTAAWRRLREYVLARDGHRCQVPGCTAVADTVGHLHDLVLGGPLLADPDDLRAECAHHNYSRGARLGVELRRSTPRRWTW